LNTSYTLVDDVLMLTVLLGAYFEPPPGQFGAVSTFAVAPVPPDVVAATVTHPWKFAVTVFAASIVTLVGLFVALETGPLQLLNA
jgi:hypothetical protein